VCSVGVHGVGRHGVGVHGVGRHGVGVHGVGRHGVGVHGVGRHGVGVHDVCTERARMAWPCSVFKCSVGNKPLMCRERFSG
jgi:hypothetical protein